MVGTMQDRIRPGHEVARPLRQVCTEMKDTLPGAAHREHPVRSVAVQKEALKEHADLPMQDEERQERERKNHYLCNALRPRGTQTRRSHVLVSCRQGCLRLTFDALHRRIAPRSGAILARQPRARTTVRPRGPSTRMRSPGNRGKKASV